MSDDQLKQDLIKQMGSSDNSIALGAVEKLRAKGWLFDGSLEGADLREANLSEVDLSGASLVGVNLYRANLIRANLVQANLSGADLQRCELVEAKLMAANLPNSKLTGAGLENADLRNADLSHSYMWSTSFERANLHETNLSHCHINHSYLIHTDLSKADLRNTIFTKTTSFNADFSNAICANTIFSDVDLSMARGLGEIHHGGPSTIGIDTIYKSGGNIPEVFLRGCGVPASMITYAKSLVVKPIDYYSCFISYSHENKSFAQRLDDTLYSRGIRVWRDDTHLLPGDEFSEEIVRGIRHWDKVLVCCSEHSLKSWWVDNEIEIALAKERQLTNERGERVKVLIPLNVDNYLLSKDCDYNKKEIILKRLAANFVGWEHDNALFDREIENVIRALQTDGGKEDPPPPKL